MEKSRGLVCIQEVVVGISLAVQWLASTSGTTSSNPGWGTKISHATRHSQKKKEVVIERPVQLKT